MEISVYHFRDGTKKVFVDGKEAQKDKDFEVESFSGSVFVIDKDKEDTH